MTSDNVILVAGGDLRQQYAVRRHGLRGGKTPENTCGVGIVPSAGNAALTHAGKGFQALKMLKSRWKDC